MSEQIEAIEDAPMAEIHDPDGSLIPPDMLIDIRAEEACRKASGAANLYGEFNYLYKAMQAVSLVDGSASAASVAQALSDPWAQQKGVTDASTVGQVRLAMAQQLSATYEQIAQAQAAAKAALDVQNPVFDPAYEATLEAIIQSHEQSRTAAADSILAMALS